MIVAALLGLGTTGVPLASALTDQWSGRWEVTFSTSGNGGSRTAGPLCCLEVTQIPKEQGLALARGTTGDVRNNPLTDVVCGAEVSADSRLYFEATAPFEFVSGAQGELPGGLGPTNGVHGFFCTDDNEGAIRGHYANDRAAEDPLINKPVAEGSLLARRGGGQDFEGTLTRLPGDFPGPTYLTNWEGTCLTGACRQLLRRPRLLVKKISTYNALLAFLRGARGARLELTRFDGTLRSLKVRETLELEAGDVITSHGMYADIEITRADGTVVKVTLEPGGSISGLADPMLIRHRGGTIIEGSAAGFSSDSAVWDSAPSTHAADPNSSVRTTVSKGSVRLSLDPGNRTLTVHGISGTATVQAGGATLSVPPGGDAVATARTVRKLPRAVDLSRVVPGPRTLSAGPVRLVVPRAISARSLAGARCLATRITSTGSARVLVTLLTGTARRGGLIAQFRATARAGLDARLCVPLSAKARGIPVGTPITIALGVRAGALRRLATAPIRLTLT
jgi:hypothetical protein